MENFIIFQELLNLNRANQNFDPQLGLLTNTPVRNRQNRLTLAEVIILANRHNFGFFIEESIEDDEENVQDFIERDFINQNMFFTDFTNMIRERNLHVRFTDNNINPQRQVII